MQAPMALEGLKVLDLSRVLAGPYCTMMLGDWGADVLKVERPGVGDDTRQWGPPWAGGESAYFLSVNRNKSSLCVDLKHPQGKAVIVALAQEADVLIENFRVGTAKELGLDYDTLSATNTGLVYCSISGYGQHGPLAEVAGYDFAIQAQAGVMSITGPAEDAPHKVGVAIVDITAGLFASNAILAALHHRHNSGRGQYIDVSLFDAQLAWLANVGQQALVTGKAPQRFGNAHPNIVPYQCFETADQPLALAVGNDRQFRSLCEVLGTTWADEERFASNPARVAHRDTLIEALQALLLAEPVAHWVQVCRDKGIPCAPVQNVSQALKDPQAVAREMVQDCEHPTAGTLPLVGPVAKLSETPAQILSPPPLLGQHTYEALERWLGYDQGRCDTLKATGAFG